MKLFRTSRIPVILLIGALLLGILSSCVANTTLVISGDDTKEAQTDAVEAGGNGTFQYRLNDAGYYEITGYTPYDIDIVDIVVPETIGATEVTSIADQAFYYCTYIKSITIPATVTSIGDYAFAGCTYLESIVIPDTVLSIGEGLFANCKSLTSVKLPAGQTTIPQHTFRGCEALESFEITSVMTEIGQGAFRDCLALKTVTIPENIERVGAQAYYNCPALTYFEMKATLDFVLETDDKGALVYDENGIAIVDDELSTIGAYMLYRFNPEIEIVYDASNVGMAAYYAHYALDKEPPELTTEAITTYAAS